MEEAPNVPQDEQGSVKSVVRNELEEDKPYETDPFLSLNKGFFREIGNGAIWTVSSFKGSFGPEKMRDDLLDTYWQSDGQLPHLINILFKKKTIVTDVCLFLCHEKDESYTPSILSLRSGSTFSDIQEIDTFELHEPNGWVIVPMRSRDKKNLLKTFLLQIAIVSNHLNGRDSHVRQIKIHSIAETTANGLLPVPHYPVNFTTPEFLKFSTIR